MKGKADLVTIIGLSIGSLGIFMMVYSFIYTSGYKSSDMIRTLQAIEKNTEKIPETNLLLGEIKLNTDKLPDIAAKIEIMFRPSAQQNIYSGIKPPANPELLPVCKKLLTENLRNEIEKIVKDNLSKSDSDLTSILVRKLDFGLILKISEENNASIEKCLANIGSYAKNIRTSLSKKSPPAK